MLFVAPFAAAQDATALLARAATAARLLNYTGTLVYQHAGRVETTRLVHLNDGGSEFEKLVNLEGPAREVIRSKGEVRCYLPRRQGRPHRAADVPQRISVAVVAAAESSDRILRIAQGGSRSRRRARRTGLDIRAEGRPALRAEAVVRARDGTAAQGSHPERAQRAGRTIHVYRHRNRRQGRPRDGEAELAARAASMAGSRRRSG